MSNTLIKLTQEEQTDRLSSMLANSFIEMLIAHETSKGAEEGKELYTQFIGKIVSGIVFKSLAQIPSDITDKKKQYDWTAASYAEAKCKLQDAVAAGFTGAMLTFTGAKSEYYCQVKTVPEVINKQPC